MVWSGWISQGKIINWFSEKSYKFKGIGPQVNIYLTVPPEGVLLSAIHEQWWWPLLKRSLI